MKKLLLILLLTIFPMSGIWSQEIIVSWQPNTEKDLAGYKLYIVVDVGDKTEYLIDFLQLGNYEFTVSAYDTAGNESKLAKKIKYEIQNRQKCDYCHELKDKRKYIKGD